MTTHNHEQPAVRAWRDRAECRDADAELFFPPGNRGPAYDAQVAAAKAVCARCPVRAECLAEALARIPYGIAGGLTEHERRDLRRAQVSRSTSQATAMRAEAKEALVDGPRQGLTRAQQTRVGLELLRTNLPRRQVALACGVTERTAYRWAARSASTRSTPTDTTAGAGEGSHGGHRAPLGSPTPSTPRQAHEQRKDTETR